MIHLLKVVFVAGCLACLTACGSTPQSTDLYTEIGGDKALKKIFAIAVRGIYKDPDIGPFFKGVPKRHIHKMLVAQTCNLIGGPCEYTGRSMLESHKDMGVTDKDFYILVEYVQKGIRETGLTYQQENLLLQKLAPLKKEIVYQ